MEDDVPVISLRMEMPSVGSEAPAKSTIVGAMSTFETSALDTAPAGTRPGRRTTIGTRIDSSYGTIFCLSPCSPTLFPLSET